MASEIVQRTYLIVKNHKYVIWVSSSFPLIWILDEIINLVKIESFNDFETVLKPLRMMMGTWNLQANTNFQKKMLITTKAYLILLISAMFLKNSSFFGYNISILKPLVRALYWRIFIKRKADMLKKQRKLMACRSKWGCWKAWKF